MSKWTDAGFPDKLHLADRRVVLEALIDAVNERHNTVKIAKIPRLASLTVVKSKMQEIDNVINSRMAQFLYFPGQGEYNIMKGFWNRSKMMAYLGEKYIELTPLNPLFMADWALQRYKMLNLMYVTYIGAAQHDDDGYPRDRFRVRDSGSFSKHSEEETASAVYGDIISGVEFMELGRPRNGLIALLHQIEISVSDRGASGFFSGNDGDLIFSGRATCAYIDPQDGTLHTNYGNLPVYETYDNVLHAAANVKGYACPSMKYYQLLEYAHQSGWLPEQLNYTFSYQRKAGEEFTSNGFLMNKTTTPLPMPQIFGDENGGRGSIGWELIAAFIEADYSVGLEYYDPPEVWKK